MRKRWDTARRPEPLLPPPPSLLSPQLEPLLRSHLRAGAMVNSTLCRLLDKLTPHFQRLDQTQCAAQHTQHLASELHQAALAAAHSEACAATSLQG